MLILAIETSCDETSLALVEAGGGLRAPRFKIKKLLTASQIQTHRPFGGVVPNLAKREHLTNLPTLFNKLPSPTSYTLNPNLIAVTVGPGLEPCLWQGINFAEEIKKNHFPKAKIVGTNHLHGHMYSFLLMQKTTSKLHLLTSNLFPAVQLIVSGGHTMLVLMETLTKFRLLGQTQDDAAGEAFDKVARMLDLSYPGGPEIERLAKNYRGLTYIVFPRPMIHEKNYNFSFSGLKTSVLYYIKKQTNEEGELTRRKDSVAASFQKAVIDVLTAKTIRAAKEFNAKSVILSGGVAANQSLRNALRKQTKKIGARFISAPKKYQGDNAAMIAVAGYIAHLTKQFYPIKANGGVNM